MNLAQIRKCHNPKIIRKIASQTPLTVSEAREYVKTGFELMWNDLRAAIDKAKPNPENGFDVAIQQCSDSRAFSSDLDLLTEFSIIHGRTAGSVVSDASIFTLVKKGDFGFIEGHQGCGGVAAAHAYHSGKMDQILTDPKKLDLLLLLEEIHPSSVLGKDPMANMIRNTLLQRIVAIQRLEIDMGEGKISSVPPIIPFIVRWDKRNPRAEWIQFEGFTPKSAEPIKKAISDSVKNMFALAVKEGRTFDSQYAHTVMVYDPRRVIDPRAASGLLPNEVFCAPADFGGLINGSITRLPSEVLASINYAIGYNGGHVGGVGKGGNKHLMIVDMEFGVLESTLHALMKDPLIRTAIDNGKNITLAHFRYDIATVEFIDPNIYLG